MVGRAFFFTLALSGILIGGDFCEKNTMAAVNRK